MTVTDGTVPTMAGIGALHVAPPRIGDLQVDAVVLPLAGDVGGDWYEVDAVRSGGASITLVDAAGYGAAAAVLAGRLRAAYCRETVRRGRPDGAIGPLDAAVGEHPYAFASAVCAVWCPVARLVRFVNAGHVPPVVMDAHGAVVLEGDPEPPLGLAGARSVSEYRLPYGAALVLCTDGLIERRRGSLDHGLAVLRSVLAGRPVAGTTATRVLQAMVDELGPVDDDVTVVVVHPDGIGDGDGGAPRVSGPTPARNGGL